MDTVHDLTKPTITTVDNHSPDVLLAVLKKTTYCVVSKTQGERGTQLNIL